MFSTFYKVKDIIDFVNYVEVKTKKTRYFLMLKLRLDLIISLLQYNYNMLKYNDNISVYYYNHVKIQNEY